MDRFWSKVRKDPEGCWEFVGLPGRRHKERDHRGSYIFEGKVQKASRVSWQLEHGEIPEGMFVCHHCDNPKCVRPDHLFLGTHADNMRDMVEKGRTTRANRGAGNGMAKLTEEQVYEIRESYKRGDCARLARKFGVSKATAYTVRSRRVWGWLPERESTAV